jgi:CRP/FNR family transcriptional regulator, anaerobic regulatory protein
MRVMPTTLEMPIEHTLNLLYPAFAKIQTSLILGSEVSPIKVGTDTILFEENQPCQGFPILLEGEVRVSRRSGEGRSLELYRVLPGELCLVSSSCLFRNDLLSAYAVTTEPTTLLMISPTLFQQCMAIPDFRNEVLALFASRMADLASLIDAVAFQRLDKRLATALLGHSQKLSRTHQDLANELGTVREVVTRLLHRFAREGWISLSREHIQINQSAALRAFASQSD